MTQYISVEHHTDPNVFQIKGFCGENIGHVHNPGKKDFACFFGKDNWEVETEELKQVVNFMEIGPCPKCKGYVHSENVLIHCTLCDYIICSG